MKPQPADIVRDPELNGVHRLKGGCVGILALDGRSIIGKDSLLSAIGRVLQFPDYYGVNWDALEECLHDMSWHVGPVTLCITHAGLIPADLLETLTEIFLGACERWRESGRVCSLFLADS